MNCIIRERYFPGRAPIEAYGNGGFRFADMSHRGSILCVPSGIHGWEMTQGAGLTIESLKLVFDEAEAIEFLLVGTGLSLQPLPKALREALRQSNISADPMSTGAAIRTYNIMLAESRPVACALIAVEI